MKKFLFILTFIAQAFLCGCSFGGVKETDEKNPSLEVLKQAFKGNYKINKRDKGVSFMYCPDNTCEKLFAPRPFKNKEFFDFAVMYFYFSSGYSYLDMDLYGKPSPINVLENRVDKIVERYSSKCNGDAIEKASCILNKLKGGIKYYNIRYDEGVKTVREGDLENKVSVKSIIEIKKWREKY